MKIVSDNLKNALDKPTTQRKGRILVGDNYYDVYNVEYYADCYDDGNVIGNAIASQLDFDLPYMPRFNTFQYFDGVWTGNEYEYVDFGTFNVFDEKDQDEFNKHITAFDNLIKFNAPFIAKEDYPKTLYEELVNICEQAGVELENTSITNGSFILENNQFVGGENLKTVLKAICGISGNYAIIKDDILKLQLKNDTDIIISKSQHKPMTWKRKSYGFNQLIIGMKDVEGEYSIRQDLEDIEKNGVHKLVINDNPFAYTPEKREELIDELFAQIKGFGYVPYELEGEWLNYVEVGDVVTIEGIETMILRINGKSPNSVESLMSAPAIIDSAVDYVDNTNSIKNQIARTEIIVDKQNQTIKAVAEQSDASAKKVAEFGITLDEISSSVSNTEEVVKDLESSIDYFSVDLAQYTLTIPTDSSKKPLETKNYDVPFYGYYKGKQVTPSSVTINGNNTGITVSKTDTYMRFAVEVNTAITNLSNDYTITFTYNSPDGVYTLVKKFTISLSIQGKDGEKGADGTSVNILGSYDSLEELKQAHPTGNVGDAYIVQGDMYVWSAEDNTWVDVGNIQGPAGTNGKDGENGKSAYQIWLEAGNTGSEQDYLNSLKGKDGEDGKSENFYVKYSANENGNPMTDSPQEDTKYMGTSITSSPIPPTSYSAYTWVKIKGNPGSNGTPGKPGDNGLTPYFHIMYSQDGATFTPEEVDENGTVIYPLGKKPSAWIGQYTDYVEQDSTNFDDYEWYKFTEDIDPKLDQMQDDINSANENINNTYTEVVKLQTEVTQNKESFEVSVSQLTQTVNTNNASMQESIDNINDTISNGVELVKNKLVTIDINGISVTTNTSAISTLLSNDRFSIKTKSGDELFFVGYDYDLQKTVSRIDNLTVTTYLTSGYHRTEGVIIDGEYRSCDFYVGV